MNNAEWNTKNQIQHHHFLSFRHNKTINKKIHMDSPTSPDTKTPLLPWQCDQPKHTGCAYLDLFLVAHRGSAYVNNINITALSLPFFGIASADDVAHSYMNDGIALVHGSIILALTVEYYNIHKRLALNTTLLFCGVPLTPPLLLLGICATTTFVSMWMDDGASSHLHRFPMGPSQPVVVSKFCRAMILGVIYSATIRGMSTLTGTGVNLILVGMWKSYFPEAEAIIFSTWFLFGFPSTLLMFFTMWGILCFLYCSRSSSQALSAYFDKAYLKKELEMFGPMSLLLLDDKKHNR
ncbi:hypothetical protein M0R45_018081 [Rubus argutus]|uniref:Citrate transporter-like domain-containing protein n=1 Tax=Rubus argutus TaxID=59490 RepID=A0AAW1XXG7_RUBAR